jgi:sulfur carrier protein
MKDGTIQISVNGEGRDVPGGLSLLDLLGRFGLDPRTVVVELNREIVRRPAMSATPVKNGDSLELVHFVGGG